MNRRTFLGSLLVLPAAPRLPAPQKLPDLGDVVRANIFPCKVSIPLELPLLGARAPYFRYATFPEVVPQ